MIEKAANETIIELSNPKDHGDMIAIPDLVMNEEFVPEWRMQNFRRMRSDVFKYLWKKGADGIGKFDFNFETLHDMKF